MTQRARLGTPCLGTMTLRPDLYPCMQVSMPADYRRSLHEMELTYDDLFFVDQLAVDEKYNLVMLQATT